MDLNVFYYMSEIINNFPPINEIFDSHRKTHKSHKDNVSAMLNADIFGGFQPTNAEIIESSARVHNPFEISSPNNFKHEKIPLSRSNSYVQGSKPNGEFFEIYKKKSQDLKKFVKLEIERLYNHDHYDSLCSKSRREVLILGSNSCAIRKRLFDQGLI